MKPSTIFIVNHLCFIVRIIFVSIHSIIIAGIFLNEMKG